MPDVIVGQKYAYREHAHTCGDPLRPVEVLKRGPTRTGTGRKVRIRWLDGEYEGLDEWVPQVRLVVRWEEAEAFWADEQHLLAALDASGDVRGTTEWEAVQTVVFALPKEVDVSLGWGDASDELLEIENLEVGAGQLGLDPRELLAEPHAYLDRFGHFFAPFPLALRLARMCCHRYATEILRYLQTEEKAIQEAVVSGHYESPHPHGIEFNILPSRAREWLREKEPVHALVREWCGETAVTEFNEVLVLRGEVQRLRSIIESMARWLVDSGQTAKANSLMRQLDPDRKPETGKRSQKIRRSSSPRSS